MKNKSDESLPEGIQTLATDLPADNAASTAAPGAAAAVAVAEPEVPFLTPGDGSWIGSPVNKNYEAFLQANKEQLAEFEAAERETRTCRDQFEWFTNTIAASQEKLTGLREKIEFYKGRDIADTIFQQCWHIGLSLKFTVNHVDFQTMLTLKEHGAAVMQLAEGEHGALEKKFREFKQQKRAKLQELGLI